MVKDISCVYCIENIVTGKKYVGSTINYNRRITKHKIELKGGYHHNKYLQKDYNLHGLDSFRVSILEKHDTEKKLRDAEQKYIDKLIEKDENYNISELSTSPCLPGKKNAMYGTVGYWKGKKMSEQARINMSKSAVGRVLSEEQKENMSKSRKGKYTGENNPMYGKKLTEEHKKILSDSRKGQKVTIADKTKTLWTRCRLTPEDIIKIHHEIKDKPITKVHESGEYDLSYGALHSIKNGYHWALEEYLKSE